MKSLLKYDIDQHLTKIHWSMAQKNKDVVDQILGLEDNSKSDLTNQKLICLDLQDKDFSGSDLKGANFLMSNLAGCNLSNCNLTDANFLNANLAHVIFDGSKRNGKQVLKFASIVSGSKSGYAFLCADKDRKIAFITEGNKTEYEWKQSNSTDLGRMLYQLLISG